MNRARVLAVAYVVATTVLAAVLAHVTLYKEAPLTTLRVLAIIVGLALGLTNLRAGLLAVIVLSPLVDVICRLNHAGGVSIAEHMFVPLLLCGTRVVLKSGSGENSSAVDRPLACFCLLAVASMATGLWEYRVLPKPLWETVVGQADRHFGFTLADVMSGPFLLIHGCIVILEGALFYVLLTRRALGLRAQDLRNTLALSFLLVAVAGVAQFVWPIGIPDFFREVQPGLLRITSTLPDPNTLGSFLVLVGPLAVVTAGQTAGGRPAAGAVLALFLFCLTHSVSRSAWVGAAVALALVASAATWRSEAWGFVVPPPIVRLLRRSLLIGVSVSVVAVFVLTFGTGSPSLSQRSARSPVDMVMYSMNLRHPANELLPARIDHWRAAIAMWRDFPMFGAGTGKFTLLKRRYAPDRKLPGFTDAHSYYLKTLAELGLVGLATFLATLAGIGAQLRRSWTRTDSALQLRVAAIGMGLLAFLLGSLAQDPLNLGTVQRVFWAMVSLVVLEGRAQKDATS